jgi:CBS domain-containing protein
MFVTDASGKIIGKLSFYDLVKGLVPEPAKEVKHSRKFYAILSSRTLEVADEVTEMQKRFKWLHSTFLDLVKQETRKKVKDVMSPIDPLLKEDDSINKAIFIMFKENIRQPLVTRGGEIIGVLSLMDVFPELLKIAGDECFLPE